MFPAKHIKRSVESGVMKVLDAKETILVDWRKKIEELRAYSGRAYAKQAISVLMFIIILQLITIICLLVIYYLTVIELNKKSFVVFREKSDGTIDIKPISYYQTEPDAFTAKSLAWNVIRYIKTAGTDNADVMFTEASRLMTPSLKENFKSFIENEKFQLSQLNKQNIGIYRVLENVTVKMLEKEDLPPNSQFEPSPYDVVVSGTVRIFFKNNNNEAAPAENFHYHVSMTPLEGRTEANPWGLLVSSIQPIEPEKSLKRLKEIEEEKAKSNDKTLIEKVLTPANKGPSN